MVNSVSISILKDWRNCAALCANGLTAKLIRDTADELQTALATLTARPTTDQLRIVNGLWIRGIRYCDTAEIVPDPTPPIAGAGELSPCERIAA